MKNVTHESTPLRACEISFAFFLFAAFKVRHRCCGTASTADIINLPKTVWHFQHVPQCGEIFTTVSPRLCQRKVRPNRPEAKKICIRSEFKHHLNHDIIYQVHSLTTSYLILPQVKAVREATRPPPLPSQKRGFTICSEISVQRTHHKKFPLAPPHN